MVAGTPGRATGEELISESLIDTGDHTDHVRLHHIGSRLPSFPERHRGSGDMNGVYGPIPRMRLKYQQVDIGVI